MNKVSAFIPLLCFLLSCASYNQQNAEFYSSLQKGEYELASRKLDQNRLLKKNRNRLLYLLEKGRLEHLLGNYEKSNRLLNEADLLMESMAGKAMDLLAGTLMNPMMETYRGEDFERYMVHYYKALNYLQLGKSEDALVEARRISLRTYAQDDKIKGKRYTEDAFSYILQGLIYEYAGEFNNAFISYRNAVNLYLENDNSYYGTTIPFQLKKDLLRMAEINGFTDEKLRFENIFGMQAEVSDHLSKREMVLFWENGLAPIKREQNLFFSLSDDGSGNYFFTDRQGRYRIPYNGVNSGLAGIGSHVFRVAVPQYEQRQPAFRKAILVNDNFQYELEPVQDINQLAITTLRERWLIELSKVLSRQAVKKLAELAALNQSDDKKEKGKNHQKNQAIAAGIKVFAMASEKADTRNWQSLPNSIYYTRVPLQDGNNDLELELQSGNRNSIRKKIEINPGSGRLQFLNITTF